MRNSWGQTAVVLAAAMLLGLQIGSHLYPPNIAHGSRHRAIPAPAAQRHDREPAMQAQLHDESTWQLPSTQAEPQKVLIVTAASWGYRAMLEQWLCRAADLGLHRKYEIAVFAMDDATAAMLRSNYSAVVRLARTDCPAGVAAVNTQKERGAEADHGAEAWGTAAFNRITSGKLCAVQAELLQKRDVIFIDSDIIINRDFVADVLQKYRDSPVLPSLILQVNRGPVTSVDAMPPCARATDPAQLGAIGSDEPYTAVDRICSGFYFARADPGTIRLIARAIQNCGENPKFDDQDGLVASISAGVAAGEVRFGGQCTGLAPAPAGGSTASPVATVCTFNECQYPAGWATGYFKKRWRADPADLFSELSWMKAPATEPHLYHPNFIPGLANKIGRWEAKKKWRSDAVRCIADNVNTDTALAPPAVALAPQGLRLADPSPPPVPLAMAPTVAPMTKEGVAVAMQGAQGHRYPVHVMPTSHRGPKWGHNATEAIGFDLSPGVGGDMFETWGFGNRLFMYAALVIRANEISQPIIPILDTTKFTPLLNGTVLPNFRELFSAPGLPVGFCVLGDTRTAKTIGCKLVKPNEPYYQAGEWIPAYVEKRAMLKHYLDMGPAFQSDQGGRPGADDVVIYFRDFLYVRQKRRLRGIRHNVFEWWQGRARLGTCPIAFYAEVLRGLTYNKVWVVANPHARDHGTVQKLVHRFDAEVFGGADAADDFRFLARAKNVILSPSTFGWWGAFYAFIGSHPDINIHWPIAPGNMGGMDWCNLMLRHPDTIARITYHDWYGNLTYPRTVDGAATAYKQCRLYDLYPVYQDLAATHTGKRCDPKFPACFGGYVGVPGELLNRSVVARIHALYEYEIPAELELSIV